MIPIFYKHNTASFANTYFRKNEKSIDIIYLIGAKLDVKIIDISYLKFRQEEKYLSRLNKLEKAHIYRMAEINENFHLRSLEREANVRMVKRE
jgi:hypothetical protein